MIKAMLDTGNYYQNVSVTISQLRDNKAQG